MDHDEQLATLIAQLTAQARQGEVPNLDEVARQHPHLSQELRELWHMAELADFLAPPSAQIAADLPVVSAATDSRETETIGTVTGETEGRFGDYDLLDQLGAGGMGVVYRARHRTLGRVVALKMIRRGTLATANDLARFRAEALASAHLDHPQVIPIYEVGEVDGQPYFTMKFVPGNTLASRLAEGPLTARTAARLILEVSRAIAYTHGQGIVHRDLKPSNILIDVDGQPRVSDFGLAKRLEDDGSVTHTGAILGTPCYMSPEQAAGSRGDVGPTSDVWSLGAILYQCLTGRPPFQAATPMDTLLAVLESDPPVPRSIRRDVDRDLELIALKSLQKPQDLRYPSAAALADDLRAFLAGDPVAARSGGLGDVVARLLRETHHAVVLENWGLLWMWHSVVVLGLSIITDVLAWQGVTERWPFLVLWGGGLALWAPIFWALRHRAGPVTAVERQIAHVWGGTVIGSVMLFWVEDLLGLPVLSLSPVLALLAGVVFFAKAGILSGAFYIQAAVLFVTALVMCLVPDYQHVIFGTVSAACFFLPGLKYFRQRRRGE